MISKPERQTSLGGGKTGLIPERKYRKPPVIEALCEIYFADSEWDDTVPGAFYEKVKNDYPKKRQRRIQEAKITLGPEQAVAGIRQLPPWMQFVSEEEHRMIQIARDLLVINQLHPYPHFEDWEPEIYRALNDYRDLANPKMVTRLGMRYINRVVIPEGRVRMEKYFTVYPNLPEGFGDTHGPFLVRVEVPQKDNAHTVLITFGTAPPPDSSQTVQAFMLDFYDIFQVNMPPDEDKLKKEIGRAHDNIVIAFEDSITDDLRMIFELED